NTPLVTVPAAIYIIFQHLLASIVKSRLAARFGDIDSLQARRAANFAKDANFVAPDARRRTLDRPSERNFQPRSWATYRQNLRRQGTESLDQGAHAVRIKLIPPVPCLFY